MVTAGESHDEYLRSLGAWGEAMRSWYIHSARQKAHHYLCDVESEMRVADYFLKHVKINRWLKRAYFEINKLREFGVDDIFVEHGLVQRYNSLRTLMSR